MKLRLGVIFVYAVLGLAACGDDDGGTPDAPTGGGGEAPVISQVRWEPAGSCSAGAASNFTVTTTASDVDTNNAQLTISGSVSSCTPSPFTGSPATIRCPNQAPYNGTVTVRDPQGNSDSVAIQIEICRSGMVNP